VWNDEILWFGEQYRFSLKPSTTKKGQDPEWGIVSKTTKGVRAATHVKRVDGLWDVPEIKGSVVNPIAIPPALLIALLGHWIMQKILFKQATAFWKRLSKRAKACWCRKARELGVKCGCYDFFMRWQMNYWKRHLEFDYLTCTDCLGPPLLQAGPQTVECGGTSIIWVVNYTKYCDYTWRIVEGGGSLDRYVGGKVTYTAPSENPDCVNDPVIECKNVFGATTISLAVNCDPRDKVAYYVFSDCKDAIPGPYPGSYAWQCWAEYFDCGGNFLYSAVYMGCWAWSPGGCGENFCKRCQIGTVRDQRTDEQKEQGCCNHRFL